MFFFLYSSSSSKTLFIGNFSQCVGLHAIRLHCIVAIGLVTKWSFGIHFPKIEKNKLFVVRHFLARFFLVTVVKLETKTARSVNTSGNSSARIASSSKSVLTFLSFFFTFLIILPVLQRIVWWYQDVVADCALELVECIGQFDPGLSSQYLALSQVCSLSYCQCTLCLKKTSPFLYLS